MGKMPMPLNMDQAQTQSGNLFTRAVRWAVASVTGPVLTKELLVTSRRGRTYLLRGLYVALLLAFVVAFWQATLGQDAQVAYSSYEMASTGRGIISGIAWFQFAVLPILAVITLSTSISDEIYHGTAAVLFATPVRGLQVVTGKLLGRTLVMANLVVIALPLLGVIRVFGGVSLGYILGCTCITLTTAMFAGALTILCSIYIRRAYAVILVSLGLLVALLMVLGIVMLIVTAIAYAATSSAAAWAPMGYSHPIGAMGLLTADLYEPGNIKGFYWPIHCAIAAGASFLVLLIAGATVRRTCLRKAYNDSGLLLRGFHAVSDLAAKVTAPAALAPAMADVPRPGAVLTPGPLLPVPPPPPIQVAMPRSPKTARIRQVSGPAMFWKELHTPMLGGKILPLLVFIALALVTLLSYSALAAADVLDSRDVQAGYVVTFFVLGMLATAVAAASTLAAERESRCLPILLTTPISDWTILLSKLVGVAKRSSPAWMFLTAHLIFFTLMGYVHPLSLPQLMFVLLPAVLLHAAAGLYFGSLVRKVTLAVTLNLTAMAVLWLLPAILFLPELQTVQSGLISGNAVCQAAAVISAPKPDGSYEFDLPFAHTYAEATFWLLGWGVVYAVGAAVLMWRAKVNLRKHALQ